MKFLCLLMTVGVLVCGGQSEAAEAKIADWPAYTLKLIRASRKMSAQQRVDLCKKEQGRAVEIAFEVDSVKTAYFLEYGGEFSEIRVACAVRRYRPCVFSILVPNKQETATAYRRAQTLSRGMRARVSGIVHYPSLHLDSVGIMTGPEFADGVIPKILASELELDEKVPMSGKILVRAAEAGMNTLGWTPCRGTETAALQAKIDALAAKGGGTLVVPKGIHPTGALSFKPGVNLHLEEGAVLLGSDDGADYPQCETHIEGETCVYYPAIVNADRCDGFTITGRGVIDGHGFATWETWWRRRKEEWQRTGDPEAFHNKDLMRPRNLIVSNSKNVRVSGVTFRNSKFWTAHFYKCENVVVSNCLLLAEITRDSKGNKLKGPCADGIDIDCCRDFIVRDCRFFVNDDAVCIKGGRGAWANDYVKCPGNGPCSNILIENCLWMGPSHSCLTLGSDCPEAHDVVMRNCRMEGPLHMLHLKMRIDTPQRYANIRVENMSGYCHDFLYVAPWIQYADLGGRTPEELKSYVTNVALRNCNVTCRIAYNIVENPNIFEMKGLQLENNKIYMTNW